MKARLLVAFLMASPLIASPQSTSTHPDLSGHWRIEESLSQLNGAGGWFGNACDITQTTKDITFANPGSGPGTGRSTYVTDGMETKRDTPYGTRFEKALWTGNRLIVTTKIIDAPSSSTKQGPTPPSSTRTTTVFLDRNGLLVVDVTQSPPSTGHFAVHSVYTKQ